MRSRIRPAAAWRWPLKARLVIALPAVLAALLVGPAVPAHAAGTVLYVPNRAANTVSVVDTSTNAITATIPVGYYPLYTAATPDGSQVFVTSLSGTVSVISTASDTVTATIPVAGGPEEVAVDPAGAFAYVVSQAGWLTKIATATDMVTGSVYVGDRPEALGISPDGATAYVSGLTSAVTVVDTAALTVRAVIYTGAGNSHALAVSPDGSKIYVAYSVGPFLPPTGSQVVVISTATDTVTARIPVGIVATPGVGFDAILGGMAVTPDGASVYVTEGYPEAVAVISTATNRVRATITGFSIPSNPTGIVINAAGTTAWVADTAANTVSVIDIASNTITGTISGFSAPYGLSDYTSLYEFVGFFPPVDDQPAVDEANAGQAIPMQFSLNGNQGLDIFNTGYPMAQQVNCSTGVPVNTGTLADTAGGSGLQYDATTGTYTYVWKTSPSWAGTCQKFILGLNDGSIHTATFQFH